MHIYVCVHFMHFNGALFSTTLEHFFKMMSFYWKLWSTSFMEHSTNMSLSSCLVLQCSKTSEKMW